MKFISRSEEETIEFGKIFAKNLRAGDVILLYGNLGSGKTQFVKGIAEFFQVKDDVTSPTFIIVNEYEGITAGQIIKISHFDLYRIKEKTELTTLGFEEYLNSDNVVLIEWPEKAEEFVKDNAFKILLSHGAKENERILEIEDQRIRTK